MNKIPEAAQSGDLMYFALVLAAVVIAVLGIVLVWLARDKLASHQRWQRKLEDRLASGSQAMTAIRKELSESVHMLKQEMSDDRQSFAQINTKLQHIIIDFGERFVSEKHCETCRDEMGERVHGVEEKVGGFDERFALMEKQLAGMQRQLDSVIDLLGKVIEVGGRKIIVTPQQEEC